MRINRFIWLAGLMLFLGIALDLHAQAPLTYSISIIERNRKNNTLTFKTTIKNISNADVIIEKHGNFFLDVEECFKPTLTGSTLQLTGGHFSILSEGKHTTDFLRLPPQATFSDKRVLPLSSFDTFVKGHRYSIYFQYGSFIPSKFEGTEVWMGTVKSNVVKFRL